MPLFKAVGFTILLSVTILTTCVWTEWLRPWRAAVVCLSGLAYWLVVIGGDAYLAWNNPRDRQADDAVPDCPSQKVSIGIDFDQRLRRAQQAYVRRSWDEVEDQLSQLLAECPGDLEARLMLATTARRRGEPERAAEMLEQLKTLDHERKWARELEEERQRLGRPLQPGITVQAVPPAPPAGQAA